MTIQNVAYVPGDLAEVTRAARAMGAGTAGLNWLLLLIASLAVSSLAAPFVKHRVHGGPAPDVCSSLLAVAPYALILLVARPLLKRSAPAGTFGVLPPPPLPARVGWVGAAMCVFVIATTLVPATLIPPEPGPPSPLPETPQVGLVRGVLPLLPWAGIFVALWVVLFQIIRATVAAGWSRQPQLHRPHTVHVEPEMITFEEPLSRRQYRWASFVGWQETTNLFVLYRSHMTFEMLPKRCFADAASLDQFRGVLWANVLVPGAARAR